jgi:negative regulator of sigma E activity
LKKEMSLFLDSELTADKADALIDELRSNSDARNDWFLYHLVGDSLRGRPIIDDGFSLRIMEKLAAVEMDTTYDPLKSND